MKCQSAAWETRQIAGERRAGTRLEWVLIETAEPFRSQRRDRAQTPSSKSQIPKKFQTPSSLVSARTAREVGCRTTSVALRPTRGWATHQGTWGLELLWDLGFGVWSLGVVPIRTHSSCVRLINPPQKSFDTRGLVPAFVSSPWETRAAHPEWLRDTARRRHGNRSNRQFDDQVPIPARI